MSFTNDNSVRNIGKQTKVGPNTKGTDRRGVSSAMSQLGRGRVLPAVEDVGDMPGGTGKPNGAGSSDRGQGIIKDLHPRRGDQPATNKNMRRRARV